MRAPAGSIACFSSTLFHRSGPNTTDRIRRVYVAQYAAEPILDEERWHRDISPTPCSSTASAWHEPTATGK